MQNARTKKEKRKQYPETTIIIECFDILTINKLMSNLERERNTKHKGRQTRDTIHMAIRDI